MIKSLFICCFVFVTVSAFSQNKKVEQAVADTACKCISKININLPKERLNQATNDCLLLAVNKNDELIKNNYGYSDDQAYKDGVDRGKQLAANVFNILIKDCKKYKLIFDKAEAK